jgi:hypothetical protein
MRELRAENAQTLAANIEYQEPPSACAQCPCPLHERRGRDFVRREAFEELWLRVTEDRHNYRWSLEAWEALTGIYQMPGVFFGSDIRAELERKAIQALLDRSFAGGWR